MMSFLDQYWSFKQSFEHSLIRLIAGLTDNLSTGDSLSGTVPLVLV